MGLYSGGLYSVGAYIWGFTVFMLNIAKIYEKFKSNSRLNLHQALDFSYIISIIRSKTCLIALCFGILLSAYSFVFIQEAQSTTLSLCIQGPY